MNGQNLNQYFKNQVSVKLKNFTIKNIIEPLKKC